MKTNINRSGVSFHGQGRILDFQHFSILLIFELQFPIELLLFSILLLQLACTINLLQNFFNLVLDLRVEQCIPEVHFCIFFAFYSLRISVLSI